MPDVQDPGAPSARRPWLIGGALWFLLALAATAGLWHLRSDALESQSRELGALSLALTDELDRGLRGVEEGLKAMRTELIEQRLPLSSGVATRSLLTRAELMPMVDTLWLVGAEGQVVAASAAAPPPDLRAFAPDLGSLPAEAMAMSRPFAMAGRHEALVALALRFQGGPAAHGGWIVAALPASTLLGAFGAAIPAADARMAVFRNDGVRLASTPLSVALPEEGGMARQLAAGPSMALRRFADGSESLVCLHEVLRYGILVLVSRDLSATFTGWRQAAQATALVMAMLLVVIAVAADAVRRANRRHAQAQQALQTQLSRASKLQSLGTLAGGVAHDFNNVLAGIVGYGEMAQDAADPRSDQARHLRKVLQAALRGKSLVERILSFSRGGARASMVFELEPVVQEVLDLLSGSLRPGIVLERALDVPGARLRGDPTQAFEAVMNLSANAMQAMPDGGMLSVQLRRELVGAPRVLSHSALAPGRYLALSVADQGTGVTPDVMEHLFEPFFTTRSAQSGTGLGLAVVHGVVAEIGGGIDVQSRPGAGARFTLYLRESTDPLPSAEVRPASGAQGNGQRLLVLDDEPELVGLLIEILEGLGYTPEGYIDADAALEALRERPRDYAGVITDEAMPGLTGTQLTEALRDFAPGLPVLLLSGYGGALLARRAAEAGVTRILAKPVERAQLARALAELVH